jgi:phosphate transport system substrate-binding protein
MKWIIVLLIFVSAGCSSVQQQNTIRISGSDTMLKLMQELATVYMLKNPDVAIYVNGGGTAAGIENLISGNADICTASRYLKPEEGRKLAEYYGSLGLYYLIAKDALSIYLNKNNPVRSISSAQLRDIYNCSITNWSEMGGNDAPIQLVLRPASSGTHYYFKEHVLLGDEYCEKNAIFKTTTDEVLKYVETNENAIGYGGVGFKNGVKHVRIDNINPEIRNARNDKYPITRYLHLFTTNQPRGKIKDFINWVLSPEGQRVINNSGYISLYEIE